MKKVLLISMAAFYLCLVARTVFSSEPLFERSDYDAGRGPVDVICADFDGDGDSDVAVVNNVVSLNDQSVAILFNDGDGSFAFADKYPMNCPHQACVADFDKDGDVDLAVTDEYVCWSNGSGKITILDNNGDGSFTYAGDWGLEGCPYGVCAADLNGDGYPDLAVTLRLKDTVAVLMNDAQGGFAPVVKYAVGDNPHYICSGDLDLDGDTDLAVTNSGSDNVTILINNGDGSFEPDSTYSVEDGPQGICIADLDQDGDFDLAVCNFGSSDNLSILFNLGDGTFTPGGNYAVGVNPKDVSCPDIDGDGYLDLAVANWGDGATGGPVDSVSILINNGDGRFASADNYAVGDTPWSICSVDLDGDGDYDLAVANYHGGTDSTLSILKNMMPSGTGSISGFVTAGSSGLLGIPVDLYDSEGILLFSAVTDDSGWYQFADLDYGVYSVSISTPLGYQADEETKEVVIDCIHKTVDFELSQLDIIPQQRGRGYWMHQVSALLSGKGKSHETYEDMCNYMELIRTHFNEHGLNPVNVFEVNLNSDCNQRLEALRTTISPRAKSSMNDKARAHLTALLLNMASGKIAQWNEISEDAATVSQAITYCNDLIADSNPENDERAKDIAEMINEGQTVPAGWIDLATPDITYKQAGEELLPTDFTLHQNCPNPFNPITEISFSLPEESEVRLEVFNIMGQKVAALIDDHLEAGEYKFQWDGSQAASGVYFYRLDTSDYSATRKMVLLK